MYNDALVIRNDAVTALDAAEAHERMYGRRLDWEPERKLCAAILVDAMGCLEGTRAMNEDKKAIFAEAARWAMSRDRSWAFAFECVCEFVGLNPQAVRRWWIKQYHIDSADPPPPMRVTRVAVPDWLEYGYTHPYVGYNHCGECRQRYQRVSRKVPPSKWKTRPVAR